MLLLREGNREIRGGKDMNKFSHGDMVRCTEGFEGKLNIRGMRGQVVSIEHRLGRVVYLVRFWANFDPWWLPADHLEKVKPA